jgi:UDPglucose 6-dehydrogenase
LNTYVTTKISYANMLAGICEKLPGSDVNVVTDAIGLDTRIGRKYLKAAVPFGGPCFPRDNIAFRSMAHDLGAPVNIAEATQEINDHQIDRLEKIVREKSSGKNIGILGLSYKPGTDVIEQSAGIHLAKRLKEEGFHVTVYDPEAIEGAKKVLTDGIAFASSTEECLGKCELALIMTHWPEFKKIDPQDTGTCTHIIDCWRVLNQEDFKNKCLVSYLGQGQKTEIFMAV